MRQIDFGQWAQVLAAADLPQRQNESWAITIKWYLGFCRRSRAGVNVQSAREFIAWAQKDKQPQPWQVGGWKEALNSFFRAAKGGGRKAVGGANVQRSTFNVQL
jgi:hypothetical protein